MIEVAANGQRFEVAEAGGGDHLALCLHGFPELHYSWRHQMPLLAGMGYRVWAPNQRGYGGSSRPRGVDAYRIERLLEDIGALFDASGASRLTLIGHDWGAILAWHFAIRQVRPIERLVIMNMPHPACLAATVKRNWRQRLRLWYMAFFQLPRLPELFMAGGSGNTVRNAFRASAVDKARFPDEVLDVYAAAATRPGAMTAMINWYRAAGRHRASRATGSGVVDVPTLIVWGDQDAALLAETLDGTGDFVRDLTIRRLSHASHWVQQDAPEDVNAILSEWLPRGG